ncbi:MAG: FtsW/RodA/SpoVE family cell cycle protein, partial [Candidatus Acidiferrales bacterium]
MKEREHSFELDWWLLFIVMVICSVGLLEIYSSTHNGPLHGMQWKQLAWIGIGFAGMLALSRIDYSGLLDQSLLLYLLSLGALAVALVVGSKHFGARRWIEIWGVDLQVS